MLVFLKAYKVAGTAGWALSVLSGRAQWRQQQTFDVSIAADHRPLWWILFRLGPWTGNTGGIALMIGDLPPTFITEHWSAVNKRLMWSHAVGWAAERALDGITDRKQERVAERANAAVPTKSILLDFWLRAFITLYHCASWGLAAKTLIKAHTLTTHKDTMCSKSPCDFKMRNFSRSINFAVCWHQTITFKAQPTHTDFAHKWQKKNKKSGNVWHWEGHQQQHVCVHVRVCVWGLSWEKWIADDAAGGKSSSLLPNKSPQTTTCLCSAGKTDATGQWQHCFGKIQTVSTSR